MLLGSERNLRVSTFLSGGSQSFFSGVILSRRRCGGTGGGTCGGGKGDETLKASELLSEALLDNGLYVCVFAAGCA